MTLGELGTRICILGPSNSGKSCLADAIARKSGLAAVHLDQLYHLPRTDWMARPVEEFLALHDEAIGGDRWVMDGNYSRCMPQRLERATGVILLDVATLTGLFRYMRRSWFEQDRRGALDGAKWEMIRHITITNRRNRERSRAMFDGLTLPKIRLETPRDLAMFYSTEGLSR